MIKNIIIFTLLINISCLSNAIAENNDFFDIIIDDTHAYTYLNSNDSDNEQTYSVYTSLMPKDEATHEGIEEFPRILQLLFATKDFITNTTSEKEVALYEQDIASNTELNLASKDETNSSQLDFTFRDLMDACKFGFCYMISDYVKTAVEGQIVTDPPDPQEVRLRKRFYLTPEQSELARDLFNGLLKESSEGKIVYDKLNHNCVDYVKEIYEAIGLDKTQGDFLSQFALEPGSVLFDDEEDFDQDNRAFLILQAYKIHNSGVIGFKKVVCVLWNIVKSCLSA